MVDQCKIPNVLACLPPGTLLVPAASVGNDGWVILPPEDCKTEEQFKAWRDQIYNNAIDLGKSHEKEIV